MATGELYPIECSQRLCDLVQTGDELEIDLDRNTLQLIKTAQVITTKPLGEAKPVIDAGGIFNFARQSGMIQQSRKD